VHGKNRCGAGAATDEYRDWGDCRHGVAADDEAHPDHVVVVRGHDAREGRLVAVGRLADDVGDRVTESTRQDGHTPQMLGHRSSDSRVRDGGIHEGYRERVTARARIGTDERRVRVGLRHRLAPGKQVATVAEAAAALVVIHASDSPSVFLQARARMTTSSPADIERELYEERSALRMLAMRRTLFLVPIADVPIVHPAASRAVAETERKRTIAMLTEAGVGADPAALLEDLEVVGLAAVRDRGEATTAELRPIDPRLSQKLTLSRGKSYEATITVGQKVFFHLALDGRIGRGRPRGTWIGSQFRWSPIERWLPDGIAEMPVDVARAELVRKWLRVFGPGTRDDIKWWTGWSLAATKEALAAIDVVEVDLDGGGIGYVLSDDLEPSETPEPWVALLPALDATTMGWTDRDWYLDGYRAALFDSAGNAGPTIWVDGRIVGGWAQRADGGIALSLLGDVGVETRQAIDREAARVAAWIAPTKLPWSYWAQRIGGHAPGGGSIRPSPQTSGPQKNG
jgi:Winged helix DNA-binding domain